MRHLTLGIGVLAVAGALSASPCFAFSFAPAPVGRDGARLADPDEALDHALPLKAGVQNHQARPSLRATGPLTAYDLSAPSLRSKAGAATEAIEQHSDDPRYNPFAGLGDAARSPR